jgi:hypothetical protein
MASIITLFFLVLPVLLMIWMMAVQRRLRNRTKPEIDPPHVEPWEEAVKADNGLVYLKRHDPNEQLSEAEAMAEQAQTIRAFGIGL